MDDVFPGIRTHEPLLPQLAAVADAVAARTGTAAAVVAAGVSGLTRAQTDAVAFRALLPHTGRAILAHDSTTSFLGALGGGRGAVVAAGTGVVTLAVGAQRSARVDGWGYLVGDAGSGYWIGRAALDAALRAYDGRGPATALQAVAEAHWPDLSEAYIALQTSPDRVRTIAAFARDVADLSGTDAVAAEISARAAEELAHSVVSALAQVAEPGDPVAEVCALGNVFRSAVLHERFVAALAARTDARVVAPAGDGLDGAAALAGLQPGHPLFPALAVSP